MIRNVLIFFSLSLFYSCKDSLPSGIIEHNKMQVILWDIFRADALSSEIVKKDSSKSIGVETAMLNKKVFLTHQITEDEFQKSYSYYTNHPELMRTILDSISAQQLRKSSDSSILLRKKFFKDSLKNNHRDK